MKNGITIAIQGKKEETLASLEEDEMDGPGDVSHSEAYNALEDFLDR